MINVPVGYTVQGLSGTDNEYTVTVTPQLEYDASWKETGRILANPTYQKNKTKVDGITFNNQMATTSIAISKK